MLRQSVISLFVFTCASLLRSQDPETSGKTLSILFIGDIMGHDEQIWSAENRETGKYDFDTVFSFIKPVISEADLAVANFEVTLAGPPYSGYPRFSSPEELAVACKNAGIDFFALANNHCIDRGKKGILSTISKLDSLEIEHTGTFCNAALRDSLYPSIVRYEELSLALLNYTYGTNGISVPDPVIVNMLEINAIAEDIEKARIKGADLIVLFLHWGTEYDTIPSEDQTEMADFLFSRGADLIIGSHPHVLQKMLWIKGNNDMEDKILVYSLGNFVSNQRKPKTDGGAMVRIDFSSADGKLAIKNAGYYLTWVYTPIVKFRKQYYILPCSRYEYLPEFFSTAGEYRQMKKFIAGSRELLNNQNINFKEFIYSGNRWILNE